MLMRKRNEKAVLIPIKSELVAKILNGEKTIEPQKTAPKCELPVEVYIYCTKAKPNLYRHIRQEFFHHKKTFKAGLWNGMIVAKFTLNNVETIKLPYTKFGSDEWVGYEGGRTLQTQTMDEGTLLKKSCLTESEIYSYLNFKYSPFNVGYAWHIDDLEIFDMPMKLNGKAPRHWQYIDVE